VTGTTKDVALRPTNRESLNWPTADELLQPRYGWDNECDVREAVKLCRSKQYSLIRNEAGFKAAYSLGHQLYNFGLREKTALRIIMTHAKPKLSRAEVKEQIQNVWKFPANQPGAWSLAGRPDFDFDEDHKNDLDDDSWMEGGASGQWPFPVDYDVKQNASVVLAAFLQHRPERLISAADDTLYSLGTSGIWREVTEEEIAAEFRATDPDLKFDAGRIMRIVRSLPVDARVLAKPFEWIVEPDNAPEPRNLALFENGVRDTATGTLLPHDGSLLATGTPAFKYMPEAECPAWMAFLGQTLDESFHATVQEMMGYLMVPDTSVHIIFVLNGVKRGGKSTTMRIAECLVGREHIVSRTLNDLAGDFGLEGTADAKLITVPDASDAEVSRRSAAVERLKTISGNDVVSINRKGKRIVEARIPARIMIACNRVPKLLDESGALASRMIQITFERSFLGKEDRELFSKLEAELPGIANWALEGLRRLRANGGRFTIGKKGEAAARSLAESQSPALRFVKEHLVVSENRDDFVPLHKVFEEYETWALEEGLSSRERRNRNDLKDDLVAVFGGRRVAYVRRRWHDPFAAPQAIAPRYRGFTGLTIKSGYTDLSQQ
jgi:P4 family phage/plasmid primase-like protien